MVLIGLVLLLNNHGPLFEDPGKGLREPALPLPQRLSSAPDPVRKPSRASQYDQVILKSAARSKPKHDDDNNNNQKDLQPGYTTKDDAGSDGDDTLHSEIEFYTVPDFIEVKVNFPGNDKDPETKPRSNSVDNHSNERIVIENDNGSFDDRNDEDEPETVDLIFLEFIQPWILLGLKFLGQEYAPDDVLTYADGRSFTSFLTGWMEENWGRDCR